jgi:hypothetical protein
VKDNMGVPAAPSGHSRAEPEEVSALRANVPNAGDWGVFNTWHYEVAQITRTSEQCVWYFDGRERRAYRDKLICWARDKVDAERASAQLTSARSEKERREDAARVWFRQRSDQIVASAIEARRAETHSGSVADESAVPQGDAHTPPESIK